MKAELDAKLQTFCDLQESASQELDPLKKQQKVLECRLVQKALKRLMGNVKSVASQLNVVVEFLDAMQTQLNAIENKLDGIQAEVIHLSHTFVYLFLKKYTAVIIFV